MTVLWHLPFDEQIVLDTLEAQFEAVKVELLMKTYFVCQVTKIPPYCGFYTPLGGLRGQNDPQTSSLCHVNRFRHLGNSILRFGRKVTIFLVKVTKTRTRACYLGICLHFHKIEQNAKVTLTLLPEQLERPMSTLRKALDLPNNLETLPGSQVPPQTPKKAKNGS